MQYAAKVKTVAEIKGLSCSEVITSEIGKIVKGVKTSKTAKEWAAKRYETNLKKRRELDRKNK